MKVQHHALTGLIGGALLAMVGFGELHPGLTIAYVVLLGVFIDLDHFIIARVNGGSWRAVRFCLSNPVRAITNQYEIFIGGKEITAEQRLVTHTAILVTGTAIASIHSSWLAILTAIAFGSHILGDLCIYILQDSVEAEQK